MNPTDDDRTSGDPDGGPLPGSAEGLIAATLALMTGYAEHCPAPPSAAALPARSEDRPAIAHLLAAKAACNLAFLAEQPGLSASLRSVLMRLRGHWQALEFRGAPDAAAAQQPAGPRACAPVAGATLCLSRSTTRH